MSILERKVRCARCGAETDGYIRSDGAVMTRHENGEYYNSWVWGCENCRRESR